jgi:hypothetical protein
VIVMTHQNLLLANGHLFARKGEASPAAVVPGFGRDSMPSNTDRGGSASGKHGGAKQTSSVLSSLIERRTGPVAGEFAGDRERGTPRPAAKRPPKGGPERSNDIPSVLRAMVQTTQSGDRPGDRPGDRQRPRRKLTLRLNQDDFNRIRTLTQFLDTTYQSILEKGVINYVETLGTGVCAARDVDQAVPISAGRRQR